MLAPVQGANMRAKKISFSHNASGCEPTLVSSRRTVDDKTVSRESQQCEKLRTNGLQTLLNIKGSST